MAIVGFIFLLFILLFPAAFIGGALHAKINLANKNLRTPITIAVYIVLVLIAAAMVS